MSHHLERSNLQVERQAYKPQLPDQLLGQPAVNEQPLALEFQGHPDVKNVFPHIFSDSYYGLQGEAPLRAMRVGLVLSGGQAPGGHNVISGIFDRVGEVGRVYGFLKGPKGICEGHFLELLPETVAQYRNMGGFDMICSGRDKIETPEQKAQALKTCSDLKLDGLVVIGGDDSNTNAALLAEYFLEQESSICVIGVPKTIDGDLRNELIEASFGFDTASKTYSEFIGNLCVDAASSLDYYHFVRVMGRSASHLAMECAMQTRANLCLIGEEVQARNLSLNDLVQDIVDLVVQRCALGKHYGVILIPEGLIEFIPEVGVLIRELNESTDVAKLTPSSRALFDSLPPFFADQLLLDRDPHGNVQVAKIATEKLMIQMVQQALGHRVPSFHPKAHYFGYEGRCSLPSNFDATYCYALGHTAGVLVNARKTGAVACIKGLKNEVSQWECGGCPLTRIMTMERRHGLDKPVIEKYLVNLEGDLFQTFSRARDFWRLEDCYRSPGPIQFAGPLSMARNYTLCVPEVGDLQKPVPALEALRTLRPMFSAETLGFSNNAEPIRRVPLKGNSRDLLKRKQEFPHLYQLDFNNMIHIDVSHPAESTRTAIMLAQSEEPARSPKLFERGGALAKLGICVLGHVVPGISNVVCGLYECLGDSCELLAFRGTSALLQGDYQLISQADIEGALNLGGLPPCLTRSGGAYHSSIATSEERLHQAAQICQSLELDALILIGSYYTLTDATIFAEYCEAHTIGTTIIGVPTSSTNSTVHPHIEACLGFDSCSRQYSQLVGNMATDCRSAGKYWYFIRLMGGVGSYHCLEVGLQCQPNVVIIGEEYAAHGKELLDIVQEVADLVCLRAEAGKDFGVVIMPEGLLHQLKVSNEVLAEIGQLANIDQLIAMDPQALAIFSPEGRQFWEALPLRFRHQLGQIHNKTDKDAQGLCLTQISTEELLSEMVDLELKTRKAAGKFGGKFAPVCHYFAQQARSCHPSVFDSGLGLAHGYLAGYLAEYRLTGYFTNISDLHRMFSSWRASALPLTSLFEMDDEGTLKIEPGHVSLRSPAFQKFVENRDAWAFNDIYRNPGPVQFFGIKNL